MELDFSQTCGEIDRQIDSAKELVVAVAKELLSEHSVEVEETQIKADCQWGLDDLEKCFEVLRQLNKDMRKQADLQLSEQESEIEKLKDTIEELKGKLIEIK